jgi:predicted amidophosphoribosyltransferase
MIDEELLYKGICPVCGKKFDGYFSVCGHLQIHKNERSKEKLKEIYGKV